MDSFVPQNKTKTKHTFLFFHLYLMIPNQSRLYCDKLFVSARSRSQKERCCVSKDKNLSATSAKSILRKQPAAFVDFEFICVKNNPLETLSIGVRRKKTLSLSVSLHRCWGWQTLLHSWYIRKKMCFKKKKRIITHPFWTSRKKNRNKAKCANRWSRIHE